MPKVRSAKKLTMVITAAQLHTEKLWSVAARLSEYETRANGAKAISERFESILKRRLVGQPEVVQTMVDRELRNKLFANSRTLPDLIYLMGMPGTGKDTAAEALTDALHGVIGAITLTSFGCPSSETMRVWQVLGSTTGYIGSERIPPLIRFLVKPLRGAIHYRKGRRKRQGFTTRGRKPKIQG